MTLLRPLLTASILACALALAAPAAADPDFSWSGALAAGKSLSIYGISGSITATHAPGRDASVTALKHGRSARLDEVRIEMSPGPSGMTICAVYPTRHGRKTAACDPEKGLVGDATDIDAAVDFTVQVPDGVRFVADQVNGDIQIEGLTGDTKAETVNGDIDVATRGLADASTVNGSITASMGQGSWQRPLRFETVNGSIRLTLPHKVDAELSAESVNGRIRSDFPSASSDAFWGGKGDVRGRIGAGGGALHLSTVNGSIDVIRAGARGD